MFMGDGGCVSPKKLDRFDRLFYIFQKSDGFELIIIIVATFGQAVLSGSSPTINIVVMLAIWRTVVSV